MRSTSEQTAYILQLKQQREEASKKRRKRVVFAATTMSLVLIVGAILFMNNFFGWPFSANHGPEASQIAIVSYDGTLYTPIGDRSSLFQMDPMSISIQPGQRIGKVRRAIAVDFLDKDSVGIYSNFLPIRTEILTWSGYSTKFRLCARSKDGTLIGLERIGIVDDLEANRPVKELLDFPATVVEILICNNNPNEIGRITDPTILNELMTDLAEKDVFAEKGKTDPVYVHNQFYRLYFRLSDNSVTEVIINPASGMGNWIETIKLPDGFAEAITAHIIGSMSEEALDYGSITTRGDLGFLMQPEAQGLYQSGRYVPENAWVDGTTGRLYIGQPLHWWTQLADDAAGDVRIEGQHIYYRTILGQAARILFEYEADESALYQKVQAGYDLSSYVKTREILADGPFIRLQVRMGVLWTLDREGNLRRNGERVAQDVTTFALDPLGVSFSSGGAIWRLRSDGRSLKLTETDAVAMAVADIYLYYSPTSGGVWRVRLDGADNRKLWDLSATKLVHKNSVLAILEKGSGKIYLSGNRAQLLETPYQSTDMDIGLYHGLVFIDQQTGGLISIRYELKWDGANNTVVLK